MSIQDKIKEIQKKPEHIRMRYVWGCVIVSMFLIVVLWVFSLTAGRISDNEGGLSSDQIMQEFQTQKQSMTDYKDQLKDVQNSFKDLQDQAKSQEQTSGQATDQSQSTENAGIQDNANADSGQSLVNSSSN